jgi:RNA polymerase sigma-70 factor (ECF subfamily)
MPDFSDYTDRELLLEISHSCSVAFSQLYDRYWESLFNTAYKRLQDEGACKDIVQDVFTDIWLRRATLQIDNIPAYLHTAIRFQVLKFISKSKLTAHFIQPFENIVDASLKADCNINEKELYLLVKAWLETLPKKRRQIYILRHEHNLSTKEISQRLNLSQKTVQNQLGNALQSLRTRMAHFFTFFL